MELLNETQVKDLLAELTNWRCEEGMLRRDVKAKSFMGAIDLVNRIAGAAEEQDHHPDLDIRYRTVSIGLLTHSAGGLTDKDSTLAREIERLAAE